MPNTRTLHAVIRLAVACLILAIGLRTWLVMGLIEPVIVSGSSMVPTLRPGDRLWIDRLAWKWREPRRWEVVVVRNPALGDELCVKRIVGLPGETLLLRAEALLVDGRPLLREDRLPRARREAAEPLPWKSRQWRLGPEEYFVLGDNGAVSLDSRLWGPVSRRLLFGRPLGVE